MDGLLEGKTAIVTGAASGIGKAIAFSMARMGANVAICDINYDLALVVSNEIKKFAHCSPYRLDISNDGEIAEVVPRIKKDFSRIDILVNNAGISMNISLEDITTEMWDKVMNVNLKGTFFMSQAVYKIMKEQEYGRIINISSMSGERGGRFAGANYSSSKGGIITLTKCFALEGGVNGVHANVICPGLIQTDMAVRLGFANNTNEIPIKRLGTPDEVANVVVFLASPLADYINGQTISVNGGQTMR